MSLYYSITPDSNKCMSPRCGGYWLTSLATTKTLCSDGSTAEKCYVANLDLARVPSDTNVVVEGSVVRGYYVANPVYNATSWSDLKDFLVVERASPPSCAECNKNSQVCVDDPSDDCTFCGCPVVCKDTTILCGGIGGVECPVESGLTCVDDPGDNCVSSMSHCDCLIRFLPLQQ
jgi:hypothetical protein